MSDERDTVIDVGVQETSVAPEAVALTERASEIVEEGPTVAGRYRILGMLGAGAMGTVYRALDTQLDEVVALKVLHAQLSSVPGLVDRFRTEVKLARKVTHPNVARVFDIGEHGAEKFLTMELVEGDSLADVLAREGPPPLPRAVEIVRSIAVALDAAHRAQIIHRDLKPENVLVAKDGRVVVTDFGIARAAAEGRARVTSPHAFVGTPAYMAPEQIEGGVDVDARADVYALGEIAFELLTGEPAWSGGEALAVAFARLTRPPPDPARTRPGLPTMFGAVVQKAMARDRDARFRSALEVADALDHALAAASSLPADEMPSVRPSVDAADITVAVLPFEHDADPETAYLADGLTAELVDGLSMTARLRVRPHRASSHGERRDAVTFGREHGVMAVVTGALRRTADGLRVSARVISVSQGFQLWARRFECQTRDLLTVTDEVAHAVAAALSAIVPTPLRKPATDGEAIGLYLRARAVMREGWHVWRSFSPAVDLMDRALERAPNDPTVRAGWAIARARAAFLQPGTTETVSNLAVARTAAEDVVRTSPHIAEAWLALATVRWLELDPVGMLRALRSALDASPSLAHAHDMLGRLLLELGAVEAAIARFESLSATEPDPPAFDQRWELARAYALMGRWDDASALFDKAAADGSGRGILAMLRGRYEIWRGARDPSWPEPGDDLAATPRAVVSVFGPILREGRVDPELFALLDGENVASPTLRLFFGQLRVEVRLAVGDVDGARSMLEEVIDGGLLDLGWIDRMPLLAPIRTQPQWPALRGRVAERVEPALTEARALGFL